MTDEVTEVTQIPKDENCRCWVCQFSTRKNIELQNYISAYMYISSLTDVWQVVSYFAFKNHFDP